MIKETEEIRASKDEWERKKERKFKKKTWVGENGAKQIICNSFVFKSKNKLKRKEERTIKKRKGNKWRWGGKEKIKYESNLFITYINKLL